MDASIESRRTGPRALARLRVADALTFTAVVGIVALALWLRWDRLDYVYTSEDQERLPVDSAGDHAPLTRVTLGDRR